MKRGAETLRRVPRNIDVMFSMYQCLGVWNNSIEGLALGVMASLGIYASYNNRSHCYTVVKAYTHFYIYVCRALDGIYVYRLLLTRANRAVSIRLSTDIFFSAP